MMSRTLSLVLLVSVLGSCFLFLNMSLVRADLQATKLPSSLSFVGNDVDSNGVLWAGDKNFSVWKSVDKGATFQFVYTLPHEAPRSTYPDPYSGMVWTVFVDSRNYLFVSCGGANNSLYRSMNGGASFSPVLNANDSTNRSFYIALTEDASGNLYTATYTTGLAQAQLLKSTDGGLTWAKIGSFNVFHFHNIKYNPTNGYLYAITGEKGSTSYNDSEKIFRSKDRGSTWSVVVDRNDSLGTVYLAMAFLGSNVYLGQDYPNRICQIQMFNDDGSNELFTPQVVYTPPIDGYMPFISGTYFNNTLIFANCAEAQNGTSRVVTSVDGSNWSVSMSSSILVSDARWNILTNHPNDTIYATMKAGDSYQISDIQPEPTPTPTPEPTTPQPTETPPSTTASTTLNPTTQAAIPPNPTPQSIPKRVINQPLPTPTPSPSATPVKPTTLQMNSSTPQKVNATPTALNYGFLLVTAVIVLGIAVSVSLLKRKNRK